jgi:hypothetical protein
LLRRSNWLNRWLLSSLWGVFTLHWLISLSRRLISSSRLFFLFNWCWDIFLHWNFLFLNPFFNEFNILKLRDLMNVIANSQNQRVFIMLRMGIFDFVLSNLSWNSMQDWGTWAIKN